MNQKIIVNVGKSSKLFNIVRGLLDEETKRHIPEKHSDFKCPRGICLSTTSSGPGTDGLEWYCSEPEFADHTFIDAATEMGKLIELLETPQIKIGNYTPEFKNGGVQVGCIFATKQEVKDVLDALNTGRSSNIIITDIKSDKMRDIIIGLVGSPGFISSESDDAFRVCNGVTKASDLSKSYHTTASNSNSFNDYVFVSAETEFGKLLELLEGKTLTVNGRPVKINGYTAEIAGVKISKETVKEVYNAIK